MPAQYIKPTSEEWALLGQIGSRSKNYRKEKGLTLAQLSECVHLSHGNLSKLENGDLDPKLLLMTRLSSCFDTTLSEYINVGTAISYELVASEPFHQLIRLWATLSPKKRDRFLAIMS